MNCLSESNKTDELKQIEDIFPKNLLNNYLIINKVQDLMTLQDINKSNN